MYIDSKRDIVVVDWVLVQHNYYYRDGDFSHVGSVHVVNMGQFSDYITDAPLSSRTLKDCALGT